MSPAPDHESNPNKLLIAGYLADVCAARDADAVAGYVAADLIQHGADLPDGADAFAAFLREEFTREQSGPPEPAFVIAEGDLVCVCHYLPQPDPDIPGAVFDHYAFTTYRIRDGRIAERWPSLNKIAPPRLPAAGTPSRAVTIGDAAGNDPEANKRLVLDFYRCVFDAQNPDAVADFIAEDYHQHVSHYPEGRSGLQAFVRGLFPGGPVPTPPEPLNPPVLLLAEGDIVVLAGLLPQPEPDGSGAWYPYFAYDAYRVRGKQLAEHWSGVTRTAPPKHPGPPPAPAS